MRAVDLFCGAGGASRGLHDAGFDVVAFDHWQPAVDTHNANGMPAHLHDLSDSSLDHLIPDCDLMWLSPPCQPFSSAGDGEGESDDRDGFPWALRIIGRALPPVALIENVKGLTFAKHGRYFGDVLAGLRRLGYDVGWKVLNTADYGVPQTRERCIIVARRDGGRVTWPMPTHTEQAGMFTAKWVTMADALGWGDEWEAYHQRGSGLIERHGDRPARSVDEPAFALRIGGGGDPGGFVRRRVTLDYRQNRGATGEPILLDVTTIGTKSEGQWVFTRPATTINGDVRVSAPGHHDPDVSGSQQADAIRLTIAELARLQDFPADWTWTGTKTQQARMIGNAVPPTLARVVALANMPTEQQAAA